MSTSRLLIPLVLLPLVCAAGTVRAQTPTSGTIAGVVRDSAGAVLPGVLVEASSPALIEKVRSATTDDEGRYRIVDLRPGAYAVTFTLTGFTTVRHEGIELTTGFVATLNADLPVGGVEETVTVTGASPVVDVQGVVQQHVFTRETVQTLPIGKNSGAYVAVIPGAYQNAPTQQDVGGTKGEDTQWFRVHNSANSVQLRDGLYYGLPMGGGNFGSSVNTTNVEEVTVQLVGTLSAEAEGSGVQINFVPRDGGNTFRGSFQTSFGSDKLQGDNLDADLQARGATNPASIRRLYDVGGGFGGPIKRDKVWFFASTRYWETSSNIAGNNFNKLQGTLFYEPDLERPAYEWNYYQEVGTRLTWQASSRDKLTFTGRLERSCNCFYQAAAGAGSPEALGDRGYPFPTHTVHVTWTRPATSRLLFEAGVNQIGDLIVRGLSDEVSGLTDDDYAVFDRVRNFRYGSPGTGLTQNGGRGYQDFGTYNIKGSVSYVTGTHAIKAGAIYRRNKLENYFSINHDVSYTFAGRVPESVTYFATPFSEFSRVTQAAIFAQDQWTIRNVTLNLGLRLDAVNGSVPEQHLAAGPFVPARDFEAVKNVPNWKDIDPRLGVAYDVFGNGRTALKASIGRYIPIMSNNTGVVFTSNPVNAMVNNATRTWTDTNGDYVPQESELGPLSAADFGKVVIRTRYDEDVLTGWHVQPNTWMGSASIQHELRRGLAVNVAYYRTWYGNFFATDNLAVATADYDQYCVNGPSHDQLPNGGGERICGVLALNPARFGLVNNFVTKASAYGTQRDVHNGVDITFNARLGQGAFFTGGLSTGQTVTDNCEIVAALPEMATTAAPQRACRQNPPWSAGTQLKLSGSYVIPWEVQLSVNYQNLPAISTTASYVLTNAQVAPELGRDLAGCRVGVACTATATIELVAPQSMYFESRAHQLNVAATRNVRLAGWRIQPRVEFHNLLNANTVLALNTRYGPTWQAVRGVLTPRLVKFALNVDF